MSRKSTITRDAAARWMRKLERQRAYWSKNKAAINARRRKSYALERALLEKK